MGQRSDRWFFAVQNWPRKGMERNVRTVRGEGKRVWDGQKRQKRCSGAPESEGTRVEEGRERRAGTRSCGSIRGVHG